MPLTDVPGKARALYEARRTRQSRIRGRLPREP